MTDTQTDRQTDRQTDTQTYFGFHSNWSTSSKWCIFSLLGSGRVVCSPKCGNKHVFEELGVRSIRWRKTKINLFFFGFCFCFLNVFFQNFKKKFKKKLKKKVKKKVNFLTFFHKLFTNLQILLFSDFFTFFVSRLFCVFRKV